MTRKIPELRFAGFSGEWDKKRLREISDITMGQSPSSKNYTDDPNELVLIQGNADLKNGKVVPRLFTKEITKLSYPDDIIFTVRAPVGGVAINKYEAVIGRGVCSISANLFLYYWLDYRNITNYWIRFSSGSTFDSINSTDLKNIEVKIPSIYEQEKIGELFEVLDACLEDQAAYVETLKKSKKAFLQKLFPQKGAKVPELRFPGFDGDWEEKKIIDVGDISTGKTPSTTNKDYYSDKGYLFITPTDINGNITTDSERELTNAGMKKSKLAKANTILFTCIASIGKNTMVQEDCCFNQQINAVYLNKNNDPYFFLTLSEIISKKMKVYASSGMMQIVNKTEFSNIKEYYPSLPEQEKIGSFFKALDEKIEKEEDKLEALRG